MYIKYSKGDKVRLKTTSEIYIVSHVIVSNTCLKIQTVEGKLFNADELFYIGK